MPAVACKVWKFELKIGQNIISLPHGFRILTVGAKANTPYIWVRVDAHAKAEDCSDEIRVSLVETGEEFTINLVDDGRCDYHLEGMHYLGTIFTYANTVVHHAFVDQTY